MALALPAVLHRNPRYSILLLFVLVCSTLLLIPFRSAPFSSYAYSSYVPSKLLPGRSLEEWVRHEDSYYAEVLKGRKELIQQYGPDPAHVDPFPPGSIFYTLWDFFIPAFNCPHRIDRLGALGDGGKWICGVDRIAAQRAPCVVYSFGINKDSSFEADFLTHAPNCQVWGYDYSVSSFGPELHFNPTLAPLGHFFPYALGAEDHPDRSPPVYTLKTLMEMNGHKFIDVLKIDIEGGEFDALAEFVKPYVAPGAPGLPIGQLEIEIHAWGNNAHFEKFLTWWENLERGGLRPFFTELNLPYVSHLRTRPDLAEYSFINVKTRHALVSEGY